MKPHIWIVPPWIPFFDAITIPPIGIFVESDNKDEQDLLNHELWHWHQYQELGLFGYYIKYIVLFLRYGYKNHPMELEAEAHRSDN